MYNRKQVKLSAKESLKGNLGLAIGVLLVLSLIIVASSYIPFGSLILTGVLSVGLAIVMLGIVRGTAVEFKDLFGGFNNFGTTCIAGILVSVFTFLWSLLFVIPGIVKSYSYAMTSYILADHPEMTAQEAIDASRKMMDGHKMDLFVLQLSFFWWYLLCGITFGIAFLYVGPYVSAATAKFYDTIKGDTVVIDNSETDTIA
ncbi:MAG: DUF975 family protein [Clostridia bacterium]|nr:DUF975 family protein [Clostridia bacterium]